MKKEFKIGYNANEGFSISKDDKGGTYYRPEIAINGVSPVFSTNALGTERSEGWATLIPGTRFRPPPRIKRRFRRVVEPVVMGDPFYFAQSQFFPYTVGGPFPEVEIPIPGTLVLTHFAIINTGSPAESWAASSQSDVNQFNYWDNTGALTNSFQTYQNGSSEFQYIGGGYYENRDNVRALGVQKITTSTNTAGDTTTTSGNHEGINFGDPSSSVLGSFTDTVTNTQVVPDETTNNNYTDLRIKTENGSYTMNYGREQPRPDGLVTDIFPVVFTRTLNDVDDRVYNRSTGGYDETHTRDLDESLTSSGIQNLYPGLTFPYSFEDSETEDMNDSLDRDISGATFTDNSSEDLRSVNRFILDVASVYKVADEGEGCLYFVNKFRNIGDLHTIETANGTVGALTGLSYPSMRGTTLVFVNSSLTIGASLGFTQGANGGWFASDTGMSILDNIPGLNCPVPELRYRVSPGGIDQLRADYDATGAYGDNESRFFTSLGAEGDVFCGYSYSILPSPFGAAGGLIGGSQINIPDPPSGLNIGSFPSQNITTTLDVDNVSEGEDTWEFYVFIPGLGSLRIPNGARGDAGKFVENPETYSPQWGSLSDPSYRGIFTLPNTGTNYLTLEGPIQVKRTFVRDRTDVYTDPTTINSTSTTDFFQYQYETVVNDFFDTLVGRKVFILNTDGANWIRFEGEVTGVDTQYIQGSVLIPAIDVSGNGLPGTQRLRGLTVDITGSVVLPQNFDEFQDANDGFGNLLYFPYIENVRNTISSNRWLGRLRSRSTLRMRTAQEIMDDPDQDTTLLGTLTVAGRIYNDAAENYAEIYNIRKDPTRVSTGINQGEIVIEKVNQPKIPFVTIAAPILSNSYDTLHLSQ